MGHVQAEAAELASSWAPENSGTSSWIVINAPSVSNAEQCAFSREMASVKHQDLAGSNIGDDHKEYFSGENALLAGGRDNTMNQF